METKKLSKFEKSRLLSSRALEIANGAKPRVKVNKNDMLNRDYIKIAEKEYEEGKLDLEVYKYEYFDDEE